MINFIQTSFVRATFFLSFLITITASYAQDCSVVERTTKKSAVVQRRGVDIWSNHNEHLASLALEKIFDADKPNDSLNYSVTIRTPSFVRMDESYIDSGGNIDITLSNGETLTFIHAEATDLGNVLSPHSVLWQFVAYATKEQFEPLSKNYISKIRFYRSFEVDFSFESQKKFRTAAGCLINSPNKFK